MKRIMKVLLLVLVLNIAFSTTSKASSGGWWWSTHLAAYESMAVSELGSRWDSFSNWIRNGDSNDNRSGWHWNWN